MSNLKITPDNLIEMLPQIGAWSSYGLAENAIEHYHPEVRNTASDEIDPDKLIEAAGVHSWQYWIEKYHREVGYTADELDCPETINEY